MEKNEKLENWEPPKTIWNYMFISIFFANMALNMGQQMSNSLLSLYAKSMNAPANQIGQLMSMFAVTALIFRFVSGPAMNSFARKKLVAMAMGFMAFAYLGFSFAPVIAAAIGVDAIVVLKMFRLLQGIGNAFGNSCCLTMVADLLPKEKFTTGMGYYACAQVVSQAIGPTIGILLRDAVGYNMTYIINFCVMCCAIMASLFVKEAPRAKVPFKMTFHNMIATEALIPSFINFLVNIGFTSINSFMLVYAEERGISGASLFFTVYAITLLITRPMVGKLTDKYGFVKVGIPSLFMTAVSLVMIGCSKSIIFLLLAALVNAFGYGAVQPMLQSLCMKSVPDERRGSASSTNYISMDLATIIGPWVCGIVAARAGYTPLMWIIMSIPVIVGILAVWYWRNKIGRIEKNFR